MPRRFSAIVPCNKTLSGRAALFAFLVAAIAGLTLAALSGCSQGKPDQQTAVILIESSPTSLDPRIGIDAQAEHIDDLTGKAAGAFVRVARWHQQGHIFGRVKRNPTVVAG